MSSATSSGRSPCLAPSSLSSVGRAFNGWSGALSRREGSPVISRHLRPESAIRSTSTLPQALGRPGFKSHLRILWAIVKRDYLHLIRYPVSVITLPFTILTFMIPIYFTGLAFSGESGRPDGFAALTGTDNFISFVVVGGILSIYIVAVFFGIAASLKEDMQRGTLESNWITPAPRTLLLIGRSLAQCGSRDPPSLVDPHRDDTVRRRPGRGVLARARTGLCAIADRPVWDRLHPRGRRFFGARGQRLSRPGTICADDLDGPELPCDESSPAGCSSSPWRSRSPTASTPSAASFSGPILSCRSGNPSSFCGAPRPCSSSSAWPLLWLPSDTPGRRGPSGCIKIQLKKPLKTV